MKLMRLTSTLLLAIAAAGLVSGCASTVSLEAAPDSNNVRCADVSVRLPDSVDGLAKRLTNAQATGAWGNPASVLLRCGLPEVLASELPCVTTSDVDWLVDASQAPSYRFITFGRNPATEVIVDSKKVSGATALDAVAEAIKYIPRDRECAIGTGIN